MSRGDARVALLGCGLWACAHDPTVVVGFLPGEPQGSAPMLLDASVQDASLAWDARLTEVDASPARPDARVIQARVEVEPGTRAQFCEGSGTAVRMVTDGCVRSLGPVLFSNALCTCGNASFAGDSFVVDAFDARKGPYADGISGASVGVSGDLSGVATYTRVRGSLVASGDIDSGANTLAVDGDLIARAPVAPCACGAEAPLDITAIVQAAHDDNDEAAISRDMLKDTLTTMPVDLPCGRLALSSVTTLGNTLISAHGRTALFIDGDFGFTGNAVLDLGDSGELELFIKGNLAISLVGLVQLGDPRRPSALRFYVAGSAPLGIIGAGLLSAQIYAPNAAVTVAPNTAFYGSVFSASFSGVSAAIHYDISIAEQDRVTESVCSRR